jgi:signal transduction histidine kinase
MADDNLLSQAILNVIINSFQAVGEEPALLLGTRLDKDSGHVQFRVVDNGSGIAAADLERIFEYYYTTKDTGTGLGLSIAQRIVHQHGGLLEVESAAGSGTAVTISLPPE